MKKMQVILLTFCLMLFVGSVGMATDVITEKTDHEITLSDVGDYQFEAVLECQLIDFEYLINTELIKTDQSLTALKAQIKESDVFRVKPADIRQDNLIDNYNAKDLKIKRYFKNSICLARSRIMCI